jgi:hypothetical protein
MFLPAVLAVFAAYAVHSWFVDAPYYYALLHPVGTTLFIYATSRSAYKAIRDGAIEWRGTRYALDELKRKWPSAGGRSEAYLTAANFRRARPASPRRTRAL